MTALQTPMIFWEDEDNYLEWVYQRMDRRGLNFNAGVEANGPTRYTYIPADRSFEKLWLRVTKRGDSYQCSSSTDGESFAVHTIERWGDGSPGRIGLFALNGSLTHPPEVDASFDFFEVIAVAAVPIETADSTPKFSIPQANLQITDEMKGCVKNLRAIYAALKKYERDKGRMPDWLSQLVPDHLGPATFLCPDDTSHTYYFSSGTGDDDNLSFLIVGDLIKIDVEGNEDKVIHGMQRVLKEHRPIIVCELHRSLCGSIQEIFKILADRGHACYEISDYINGVEKPLDSFENSRHIIAKVIQ